MSPSSASTSWQVSCRAERSSSEDALVRVYTYAAGQVTLTFKALPGHSEPKIATILDAPALNELKGELGKSLDAGDSNDPGVLEAFLAIVRYSLRVAEGESKVAGGEPPLRVSRNRSLG